jgi:trehalose synthase
MVHEVPVVPRPDARFVELVGAGEADRYEERLSRAHHGLGSGTLWHVNSTAEGGGVAELLRSCLGYLRDGGVETRWLVFDGDDRFFAITKRIHNRLHGDDGDHGELAAAERAHYDRVTADNLAVARSMVRPGDVVVVHDPQPLGLVPGLADLGATVIWTCHVGIDVPNDVTRSAWHFLRPDVDHAAVATFSRRAYIWDGLDPARVEIIPPCIDGFALKNEPIDAARREAILTAAGVVSPTPAIGSATEAEATFVRSDGAPARVEHRADMDEDAPVPAGAPLVTQVSRWDRLKDPLGVLAGFVQDPDLSDESHLILAGPAPSSVADDPEAEQVLGDVRKARADLRPVDRARVHLANLPTADVEENAVIVNALQRRADVVVQKSIAEGFGLTVTEAMWKRRPVVASRVGGIQDQIADGESGLLVDPRDLVAFGNAVQLMLDDPVRASAFGAAAHERVRQRYLAPQYLGAYLDLIARLRGFGR